MPYTVIQLVNDAFYTSGIVSREFQTVQGSQVNDGLQFLNDIIMDKTVETDMLPYYTTGYPLTAIIGQEKYFIPNLIEVESLVFFIGNPPNAVRYSMFKTARKQYFGSSRAENTESLPFTWHYEACFGGGNLFLYFLPEAAFNLQVVGLFRLSEVTINQDLTSKKTTANLGIASVTGAGTFGPGELVINGVDLAGTYLTPPVLVNFINTGVIPDVIAIITDNQFILTNIRGDAIVVTTAGTQGNVSNLTFSYFSTTSGPLTETFFGMALDRFYISYLKYALAVRLCNEYNFVIPPGIQSQYDKYVKMISKQSATLDLHMTKISTMTKDGVLNYGQVNLGHGWTAP